jgi:hypothetical protein
MLVLNKKQRASIQPQIDAFYAAMQLTIPIVAELAQEQ